MGRGGDTSGLHNAVRRLRTDAGITQADLARRAHVTRQALSGIEAGSFVPNTAVSLRLAAALGCRVEDLFSFEQHDSPVDLHLVRGEGAAEQRIAAAQVRGRVVGYPIEDDQAIREQLVIPDAVVRQGRPEFVTPAGDLGKTAVLLGCDPALGILGTHLQAHDAPRLLWLSAGSTAALRGVRQGEAHIAGTHLPGTDGGENRRAAARALAATGGIVVVFAAWELGLAVQPANPLGIREIADLARPDVRVANREPGSGSRALQDSLLARTGLEPAAATEPGLTAHGHFAVARAVRDGRADTGVCPPAVAHALGLDLVPLAQVRFDLVIPSDHLPHPAVAAVLELLTTRPVRATLGALRGYDASNTGEVIARVAPRDAA